jgi:hypothetical protein
MDVSGPEDQAEHSATPARGPIKDCAAAECLAVPELTRSAGIQLNERVSLRDFCVALRSTVSRRLIKVCGTAMHLKRSLIVTLFALGALLSPIERATATIYDMALGSAALGVTGQITTVGIIGALQTNDVTDWNLSLTSGPSTIVLTESNSSFWVLGSNLTATTTGLFWNFDAPAWNWAGFSFPFTTFSQLTFLCFNGAAGDCDGYQSEVGIAILDNRGELSVGLGPVQIAEGVVQIAEARIAAAPEPSTWAMLLIGFAALGFMVYRKKNSALRFA